MADALVESARQAWSTGASYLLAQQAADGGWHSQTYGQLKDGAAVTALVCFALTRIPADLRPKPDDKVTKGLAFLARGLAKRGTIASPDGSLDFPTYAGALWLLARGRVAEPDADGQRVRDYLLAAQVAEPRGFLPDSPSYGGWDFLGKEDAQGITTGTNVSVTRHVVEALQTNQPPDAPPPLATSALKRARAYLERCQNPDGGLAFTCEPMSQNNKAAYADDKLAEPRSYGTATCDGILGLVACGMPADDERIVKAVAWLAKRPGLALVPGFEGLPPEAGWQRGLRYYYYAGLARVLPRFPQPDIAPRREALVKQLVSLQQASGAWVNESDRMRENDPLIATSLAIIALAACVTG
ncbi:MAG: prenyltransferase/squalene oxidase repeat-containing protein [Pirellulaceae bacterium]|nr:prenyltransferase/squalene oxidase repeat-containing protein [Pirellulaceae bacterium]